VQARIGIADSGGDRRRAAYASTRGLQSRRTRKDPFVEEIEADSDRPWRPASSGPSFVYVLPCFGEDLAKIGMSRDPLDRFQTLHPRWFEFFDVDDGLLVETDSVREARAIELRLGRDLVAHAAPSPLTVSRLAGGHTEWFRGLASELPRIALARRALGYAVHQPLRGWLRIALLQRTPLLFHWTSAMLAAIEDARHVQRTAASDRASSEALGIYAAPTRLEHALRDALDAFAVSGVSPKPHVPDAVITWWRALPGTPDRR
jgi:hypothetical protein